MDKKDFKKYIKELLKEKGYISIKTNKFVIEFSECYVMLLFNYGNENVVINYNISFKAVHGLLDINNDFTDYMNCDFNLHPILNHYCDTNIKFRANLYQLDYISLKETFLEMLKLYVDPFSNSIMNIIKFINIGRKYNYSPYSKEIYIEPYRFLSEAENFLLANGMKLTEEFFS